MGAMREVQGRCEGCPITIRCSVRAANEVFALSDRMKHGWPLTGESFRSLLGQHIDQVERLGAEALDLEVREHRRRRYTAATWTLQEISLEACAVWPRMGGRPWATGPVPKVAALFPARSSPDDRIRRMVMCVSLFRECLPLQVLAVQNDLTKFRIDDGCDRAVAMYLAGVRTMFAFVGIVRHHLNHQWPWSG